MFAGSGRVICCGRRSWYNVCSGPIFGVDTVDSLYHLRCGTRGQGVEFFLKPFRESSIFSMQPQATLIVCLFPPLTPQGPGSLFAPLRASTVGVLQRDAVVGRLTQVGAGAAHQQSTPALWRLGVLAGAGRWPRRLGFRYVCTRGGAVPALASDGAVLFLSCDVE